MIIKGESGEVYLNGVGICASVNNKKVDDAFLVGFAKKRLDMRTATPIKIGDRHQGLLKAYILN